MFLAQRSSLPICCSVSVLRGDMLCVVLCVVSSPKEAYCTQCSSIFRIDRLIEFLTLLIRCESAVSCTVEIVKYNDNIKILFLDTTVP